MKVSITAIIVMILWASCYPLIVLSLNYAPAMLTAFFRASIAGVVLVIIAAFLRKRILFNAQQWINVIAIGLTATSIGFWGMFYAGNLISPGLATVLTNTQPLIAGVLGYLFLKERPEKMVILAMALGFIGIFIISSESVWGDNKQFLLGFVSILTAAIGIAISNILLKRVASNIDIFYAMGFQLLVGAVPLGLYNYYEANSNAFLWSQLLSSNTYLVMVFLLAIPGTALPFLLWFWLLEKAPLYQLNIYSFLTPVFGLYLGWFYFDELLSIWQWIGIIIVASSVCWVAIAATGKKNIPSISITSIDMPETLNDGKR